MPGRETVVELQAADCGLLSVGRDAANRVTINCWYQRRYGATGVVQHASRLTRPESMRRWFAKEGQMAFH
jgi:hypothetical protein